jgi:hypothetical protein
MFTLPFINLGISFGAPFLLLGLLALPILWWLLKITPPQPRRVAFPPLRLLKGLADQDQTPAATPWWLLLLRLLAAALVIVALADPLLGQPPQLKGQGPLVLVVDNGWQAAPDWAGRQNLIADLLHGAGDRPVALIPTAGPQPTGLLNAGQAARLARELKPMPWPGDRKRAAETLAQLKLNATPALYWLSDGIADDGAATLQKALDHLGGAQIYAPAHLSLGLASAQRDASGFSVTAIRAQAGAAQDVKAAAIGTRGETLAAATIHFAKGATSAKGHIALPMEVRNHTVRLTLLGQDSAGTVQLLDRGAAQRSVGIVSEGGNGEEQPLLSDVYYLERALSPYAEVSKGTIAALLDKKVSVLVLADVAKMSGTTLEQVKDFVARGGVLIRFAGPRMAAGSDDLVPVPLRIGGRYLGSAMAWSAPQHLAPFSSNSPFNGLEIPAEVTVTHQILAQPSANIANHTWARLKDGTPLITAAARDRGWVVLFHVTAGPAWSSLPLSGLYVDMLKRLLALAAGTPAHALAGLTSLPPVSALDGFGQTIPPAADVAPIAAKAFAATRVSQSHPPGLYGANGAESALNVVRPGDTLTPLAISGTQPYGAEQARPLEFWLLAASLALLLLDMLIALWLRGFTPRKLRWLAPVLALLMVAHPGSVRADDAFAMKAALNTRLAYVKTGLADVDAMSEAGLTGLGLALRARTSYEPEAPMGVDLKTDDLSLFPLLYWPMDPREKNLSPEVQSKLNEYMRHGGTIFFDTRDLTLGAVRGPSSAGEQTLRRLTAGLDIPPLEPVPDDHVLTKSFYILRDFPGRWSGGQIWVEKLPPAPKGVTRPARGGDGVSPVIIGGNDWAAAWAVDANGHFLAKPSPGGESQREMAFRVGINVVMYALTGNYKADQVHAPALLERMDHEVMVTGGRP